MNDTVKGILSEKLDEARRREGLNNSDISQILGLKSKHYAGRICSKIKKQRDDCSEEAWKAVQQWTNSGLSLRRYGEKMGKLAEAKQIIEDTKTELGYTEVNEDFDAGSIAAVDFTPYGAVIDNEEPIDMSEKTLEAKAIPEDPAQGKFRVEMQIVDKPKIGDMPLDRLKIIFDAINELKQMGYRVDINIYEKEGK